MHVDARSSHGPQVATADLRVLLEADALLDGPEMQAFLARYNMEELVPVRVGEGQVRAGGAVPSSRTNTHPQRR
jgi:hypothetical protein